MIGRILTTAAGTALVLAAAVVVLLALVILVRAFRSRRLAELAPWHADRVPEELRAADYAARPGLAELFARERSLVAGVERRMQRPDAPPLDRYRAGGRRHPGDRNLSFLLEAERPARGALLLHGLSDSPYLMRSLAAGMHRDGATVLALRLPGHGTVPGGLLSTRWQDWVAASEYGVERLRELTGELPLWIAGFSTGGTLALLQAIETSRRGGRQAAGLILLAPAVELPWVARFALWHRSLAWLPYFTKFRWQEIKPEYDPCKYGSFPKRAGAELFELTRRLWSRARALDPGQKTRLPPILACQSLADDSLVAGGIAELLRVIGRAEDELVLFDINHAPELDGLIEDAAQMAFPADSLVEPGPAPFAVTLVSNRETGGRAVEALGWPAGSRSLAGEVASRRPLEERWPDGVYSLSHLALPMAADDPLYGAASEIGGAVPRGERGVLAQPLDDLLRLRWNPFYRYLSRRVTEKSTR